MIVGNAISPFNRSYGADGIFNPLTDLDGTLAFWGKQTYVQTAAPLIDEWTDESTNSRDATQAGADRPDKIDSVINGFDVIRFDGGNEFLDANESYESSMKDQLGYGLALRIRDGRPASAEAFVAARNNPVIDRGIHLTIDTAGRIEARFRENSNEGFFESDMQLPNGEVDVGIIVWVDKNGDNKVKVGLAQGTFTQLADNGNDGDLTGVTPADITISESVYWGALNNGGSSMFEANIDIVEGFIQSGMTQKDFDNWGQRFLDVYAL